VRDVFEWGMEWGMRWDIGWDGCGCWPAFGIVRQNSNYVFDWAPFGESLGLSIWGFPAG